MDQDTIIDSILDMEKYYPEYIQFSKDILVNIYNRKDTICLIHTIDDKIVGYIISILPKKDDILFYSNCLIKYNCPIIVGIAVLEEYRGKGIGKILLNKYFNKVREYEYNQVFLEVLEENVSALNLYKKVGFKIKKCKIEEEHSYFIMYKKLKEDN
jgi:ribosomal protein S18 acetylase RimI-like enzyme